MIQPSTPRTTAQFFCLLTSGLLVGGLLIAVPPQSAEAVQAVQAKTAEVAEDATNREKPENPLKRLLEGILKKPGQRLIPKPEAPQSTPAEGSAPETPAASVRNFRDWVDRCAPHDYELEKLLEKVNRNLELKAWKIALEQLQQILDQPNHRISLGPGRSRLSRDEIHRIISQLPNDAQQSYELQFGIVAQQAFEEAKQQGQLAGIADVASRYLSTQAGMEAADYLAAAHLDRGEWIAAAIWYQRILSIDPQPNRPPVWFLKAAVAFQHAGLESLAQRMSDEISSLEAIQIADRPVSPKEILNQMIAISGASSARVTEWPQFRASPTRSAYQSGEVPVLVPQWEMSSTNSIFVQSQIRELTNDLRRAGEVVLPVVQPLVLNNRFAVRTLNGVAVVERNPDRQTDQFHQVWQTRRENTPEQIVTGVVDSQESLFSQGSESRKVSIISNYSGTNAETHPLTGLLYRNGMYGMISADRDRLYVPERHAWLSRYQPGYFSTRSTVESRDPLKREWSSNSLTAYDLETGRIAWEIGGRSFGETFELPLAGYYFLGPPLVVDDELYIVGEKENQIQLICLEATTGHPHWTTPIGFSLHEPAVDLGRRWWTAQPALRDGILVVPNSTGWLLGVDLATHSVIWETRFTKPTNIKNTGSQQAKEGLVESQSLDRQWHLSAPVIVGNRVYHTPRETDKLLSLRLVDGDVIWEIPKGDLVALLHADERQLIFATTYGLQCYATAEEKVIWEYRAKEKVVLSGLPAVTETDIYAPWSDSSLTRISRADGKLVERRVQPPGAEPLGNLRFADNFLISAGPLKTVAFELKSSFEQKLARRLEADPQDAWGLLQKAQLSQLAGDPEKTLSLVESLDRDALSVHDQEKQNELVYQSLVSLIRADLKNSKSYLDRLDGLDLNRERRREAVQLELARMVALGEYQEAFDRYLAFSQENEIGSLVPERPGSRYRVQYALLLKRGLNRILEECPSDVRATLNQQIEAMVEAVDLDDTVAVRRLLLLFPNHPAIETLCLKLARKAVAAGELSVAEYYYRRLLSSSIRPHAADAAFGLDSLYQKFDRRSARRQLRAQMKDVFERVMEPTLEPSPSGETEVVRDSLPDLSDWGEFSINLHQGALSYQVMNQYRYRMIGDPMPLLPDIRYNFNSSSERLQIHSTVNPDDLWSVPMRNSGSISSRKRGLVRSLGHTMFVIQSNNITAISPLERRVLWNRSLQSHLKFLDQRSYSSYGSSIPGLVSGSRFGTQYSAVNRQKTDPVIALTPDLICIRSQRELQAFHPLTGELLWTIEKISNGAQIISNGNLLYVMNPSADDLSWKVFLDEGRRVPLDNEQRDRLLEAVAIIDGDVVVMESSTYRTLFLQTRTVVKLRRLNLETGEPVWEWENNGETMLGMTGGGIVILDRKQKSLSKIDFETGKAEMLVSLIGRLPTTITEAFLVESNDRLYLIANGQRQTSFYRNYYLDSVPTNGDIIAIDPDESRILWSREVRHQHLLLDLIEDSPVLLFLARKSTRIGNIYRSSQSILTLDQKDGRELLEYESPYSSDFQAVHLDHQDQKISLMSYNSRMVLSAIPPLNEPLKAPKPKPEASEESSAVSATP